MTVRKLNWPVTWKTFVRPGRAVNTDVVGGAIGCTAQFLHSVMRIPPACLRVGRKTGATGTGIGAGVWSTNTDSEPPTVLTEPMPKLSSHFWMVG